MSAPPTNMVKTAASSSRKGEKSPLITDHFKICIMHYLWANALAISLNFNFYRNNAGLMAARGSARGPLEGLEGPGRGGWGRGRRQTAREGCAWREARGTGRRRGWGVLEPRTWSRRAMEWGWSLQRRAWSVLAGRAGRACSSVLPQPPSRDHRKCSALPGPARPGPHGRLRLASPTLLRLHAISSSLFATVNAPAAGAAWTSPASSQQPTCSATPRHATLCGGNYLYL